SASAATLGATALKGTVAGKSVAAAGLLGDVLGVLGPLLGFLGGYIGGRISIENTKSPRERRFMVRLNWVAAALAVGFTAAMLFLSLNARAMLSENPRAWAAAV